MHGHGAPWGTHTCMHMFVFTHVYVCICAYAAVMGKMSAGISNMQQGLSNMWHSLKVRWAGPCSARACMHACHIGTATNLYALPQACDDVWCEAKAWPLTNECAERLSLHSACMH